MLVFMDWDGIMTYNTSKVYTFLERTALIRKLDSCSIPLWKHGQTQPRSRLLRRKERLRRPQPRIPLLVTSDCKGLWLRMKLHFFIIERVVAGKNSGEEWRMQIGKVEDMNKNEPEQGRVQANHNHKHKLPWQTASRDRFCSTTMQTGCSPGRIRRRQCCVCHCHD